MPYGLNGSLEFGFIAHTVGDIMEGLLRCRNELRQKEGKLDLLVVLECLEACEASAEYAGKLSIVSKPHGDL